MDEQAYNDTKNQIEELDLKNQETDANGEPSSGLAGGMTQDEEEHLEFTQSLVQVREMSDKIEDSEEYKLAQSVSQDSRNKKEALKAALKRAGVQACLLKLRRDQKDLAKKVMEATAPVPFTKHKFNVFDFLLTVAIIINCVLLAMDRPTLDPQSLTARTIIVADSVFLVVFSFECVVKVSAMGLLSAGTHFTLILDLP